MSPAETVRTLRRRREFLAGRFEIHPTDYDAAEMAALETAIRCVKMAVSYGVIALSNFGEPVFRGQLRRDDPPAVLNLDGRD